MAIVAVAAVSATMKKRGYSQFGEDKFMERILPNSYAGGGGVCVDVGAEDGITGNNTYLFEKKGWRCLCIEPNPDTYKVCSSVRKECINVAISNEDDYKVLPFTIFSTGSKRNESAISSLKPDPRLASSSKLKVNGSRTVNVVSRTLASVLNEAAFPPVIDFISIDTEGTELDVLKSMDFNKYTVKYLIIENNFEDLDIAKYLDYLGFVKIKRLGVNDIYKNNGL